KMLAAERLVGSDGCDELAAGTDGHGRDSTHREGKSNRVHPLPARAAIAAQKKLPEGWLLSTSGSAPRLEKAVSFVSVADGIPPVSAVTITAGRLDCQSTPTPD